MRECAVVPFGMVNNEKARTCMCILSTTVTHPSGGLQWPIGEMSLNASTMDVTSN